MPQFGDLYMITNLKALCKLYIPIPTEDITVIAGYDTPQESPSQIHIINCLEHAPKWRDG